MLPIVSSTMMGVSILTFQRNLASIAKHDAWISMFLGTIVGVISAVLLYNLIRLNPGLDFAEIVIAQAGNWVGRLLIIPIMAYILIDMGLSLRVFSFALKNFLLDRTPIFVISLVLIIFLLAIVAKGIGAIAGVADILYPFFVISLILLIALSATEFRKFHIMPVLHNNMLNTVKGSLPAFGAISGYSSFSYVMKYINEPKKAFKWFCAGFCISSILYIVLTLATVLSFVPELIERISFPTLFLSKSIEVGGSFLERLEAFMVLIWVPAVFTSVGIYTFASVRNFCVLFSIKPKHEKYVTYAHIPLLLAITLYPKNQLQATNLMDIFDTLALIFSFGFVPLILLLTLINKRRKAKNESKK